LNPEDNLEEFGPVSDVDLAYFKQACDKAAQTGKGIIATFGGTAFGDIALVPAPFLKEPKGIRDITEWYISTMTRADYIHEVFQKQSDIALANLVKIYAAVGDTPDAVFICGTDFGTQNSQFCSTDSYNEMYAPYYKKITSWIHENTGWKTFKHSCGAVEPFMSHFVDSGFDIINPVQCSADGMDPSHLKDKYGQSLTFWGGGVDTQMTLPFGTADEVRKEVAERLKIFSKQGGFVFDAIHNVQALTPIENMVALFETVKEFNADRS
jgi:uroporphyrinogen-III decarboxylase